METALAQEAAPAASPSPSAMPDEWGPRFVEPTMEPRVVPKSETAAACREYEGRFISHYGDVFKVESCRRRRVQSHSELLRITRAGTRIVSVDARPIAAFPEGRPIGGAGESMRQSEKPRTCQELNGKYVTYSFVEIYFVEGCKKRIFPDYATYAAHRRRNLPAGATTNFTTGLDWEVLGLAFDEFSRLESGKDFPSMMEREYARMATPRDDPDVIPIDEACRGVDGRVVSYHGLMYRVERCRKRPIDPQKFSQDPKNRGVAVRELTAEQWVSIPTGKPIDDMPLGRFQEL